MAIVAMRARRPPIMKSPVGLAGAQKPSGLREPYEAEGLETKKKQALRGMRPRQHGTRRYALASCQPPSLDASYQEGKKGI